MTQKKQKNGQQGEGRQTRTANSMALSESGRQSREFLREITRSEVPEWAAVHFHSELSQDHVLANYDDEDLHERKYLLRNNAMLVKGSFPPEESVMRGELREEVIGDDKEPLSPAKLHYLRDIEDVAYARATRGEEMAQQEIIAEQTQHVVKEDKTGAKDSLIDRIFG